MSNIVKSYSVPEGIMPHGVDERQDERLARLEHLEQLREALDWEIYNATSRLEKVVKEIEELKGETNATRPNE